MPDKIRLGFIGCGNMGQIAHIRNYAQLTDDCELVALAELRPELSKNVAERYGISEVYSDHQTMLAEAEIDAVVAIMYYGIHYTVVPDVLSAGKHLITEKPMGCDPLTALQWKSLADENDLVYLVGYMKRWDVAARHLAERVKSLRESGELGQLRYLRCNMSGTDWTWNNEPAIRATEKIESPPSNEPFPQKLDVAQVGFYNMNINFYVHQVNLIRFLLGEDFKLTHTHPDGKVLLATTDSGIAITLEMGLHQIPQTWDEDYYLSFEDADFELKMPAPLRMQTNGELSARRGMGGNPYVRISPNMPPSWSFFEQAKGFLAAVKEGRAPFDSAGDGVKDLEFFVEQARFMKEAGGNLG